MNYNENILELWGSVIILGIFGLLWGGPIWGIICMSIVVTTYIVAKQAEKKNTHSDWCASNHERGPSAKKWPCDCKLGEK